MQSGLAVKGYTGAAFAFVIFWWVHLCNLDCELNV